MKSTERCFMPTNPAPCASITLAERSKNCGGMIVSIRQKMEGAIKLPSAPL